MKRILMLLAFSTFLMSCNAKNNAKHTGSQFTVLPSAQYEQVIGEIEDVILIDVRTAREFNNGHLPGAINIDYTSSDFETKIQEIAKDQPIYIYCQSGNRSEKSARIMQKLGFNEIYDLQGGIRAWKGEVVR